MFRTVDKRHKRQKRAMRLHYAIKRIDDKIRLRVFRSAKHIYCQILKNDRVLASASSLDKELRSELKCGGNIESAKQVGMRIAKRVKDLKIEKKVVFDRAGYKYHGRVKALAEAAREGGIDF